MKKLWALIPSWSQFFVHFVTKKIDGGPVICQEEIAINPSDTAEELSLKVLKIEHIIYSKVIHWYTQNRIKLIDDNTALLDGKIIWII